MANKTRITRQITIRTHSITFVRKNGKFLSVFCQRCRAYVAAFAPEQIAAFLQLSVAEVCRLIETDEFHLLETERGAALVCGESLNGSKNKNFSQSES